MIHKQMDIDKILLQLTNEISIKTKYCPRIRRYELVVHRDMYNYSHLSFCIKNDKLILSDECYWAIPNDKYKSIHHDIVVGEIDAENIIEAMDLFVNYGKENDDNGIDMSELLNKKYVKIKSARKI